MSKSSTSKRNYVVVRDEIVIAEQVLRRGETVALEPEDAALLVRDGMIQEEPS